MDTSFDNYYNLILRFLSFRPRSEKEIKDKLKSKKADPSIIEKIILKLKEQKFLDDKEFVKWWIEQRTAFKPKGMILIKKELKQKGINEQLIEEAINSLDFEIKSDKDKAKGLISKKILSLKGLPRQKIYQKLGAFLLRKGFDYETIKNAVDEIYKERV